MFFHTTPSVLTHILLPLPRHRVTDLFNQHVSLPGRQGPDVADAQTKQQQLQQQQVHRWVLLAVLEVRHRPPSTRDLPYMQAVKILPPGLLAHAHLNVHVHPMEKKKRKTRKTAQAVGTPPIGPKNYLPNPRETAPT